VKIAVKGAGSGWVIDNIADDYKKHTRHQIVELNNNPDAVWCIDVFSFPAIIDSIPKGCRKFLQIHHVNEDQLGEYNFQQFKKADICIVPNKITEKVVSKYIDIPVRRLPYWVLSTRIGDRNQNKIDFLRRQISIDAEILIGSFVKDGNGKIGETPKMIKGPDIFVDAVVKLSKKIPIKVVLGGYGRAWVIKQLQQNKIPYVYYENYDDINSLYDCLDYYFVTARVEGGAQAVLEGSYRMVKVLSTNSGIAPEILHPECICYSSDDFVNKVVNNEEHISYNYESIKSYLPDKIISKFDDLFEEV